MGRKIDWKRDWYKRQKKTSIKDEEEWRDNDKAAKWLSKVEDNRKSVSKPIEPKKQEEVNINMGYPVHVQTEREALRLDQVEEFAIWLEEYGWERHPTCDYEVLRMSHLVYEGLILVWKREERKSRGFATLQGPSTRWYYRWKKYNAQIARNTRSDQRADAGRAQTPEA